ncbi:SPASM domain-containing protein, partial [Thermodesulfobacteriota bacterium]
APNHLKILPQCDPHDLRLSNSSLTGILAEASLHILEKFGDEGFNLMTPKELEPSYRNKQSRIVSVCGVGLNGVDLHWNGDVYPCNLLKDEKFVLGNLFREDFGSIFRRVEELGIRVPSHEIPKCSKCLFVNTCGGGCRAGSHAAFGTFEREDNLCSCLYEMNLSGLLLRRYRQRRDLDNCKRVLRLQIESQSMGES